ncbi:MAG: type IX secretion system PorP/SprF family membrane protein [Crocinitomicaceae bacterium]|jgi:type IX secretion system PorP/SprF family membrane protein
MKRKLLVFSSFVLLAGGAAFAQQDKLITHFMYDKMSLNPGSTGINEGICATTIYRNQWDKVNGAPNSAVLNVEANLQRFFPGGVGISFYHDAIGFTRQNNVLLNYSFPLHIQGAGVLGIGVGVGMVNVGMNPLWVPPTNTPDPSLPVGFGATNLDLNFGLYFKGEQNYYVGISSTHLSESVLTPTSAPSIAYNSARHYYLMGGKKFLGIASGPIDIDANVLVRTDIVKLSSDINVRAIWDNKAYGGITYRTSDAVAIMLGADPFKIIRDDNSPLDNLLIGYSYDISINKLSSISRGSHEIFVKYCYYLPPVPIQKAKHPRWL